MNRAVGLLGLLLALVLMGCSDKAPTVPGQRDRGIHALFVGIDEYRFSDVAGFSDLKGAVGDTIRFKQALGELYGVAVDAVQSGSCESSNATSVTLTDDCATRARILAALDAQIAALEPGDTLLFYFAGHGSQYRDDEAFDQDTGYNGTILPTDARNPDGSPGDIFDLELKARKDKAVAAGIYFVTIFDSCNSATATRDGAAGQSRSVPPLAGGGVPAARADPAPTGPGGGYWVHLAAAQDGEEAQETASGAIGARAGVFTSALIDTLRMPGMREATFGDIIKEVRLRVATRGHVAQTPSAEGELTAALGSRTRSPLLFTASAVGSAVTLEAGALSGVTAGSKFALYTDQASAVARRDRLATATAVSVDGRSARLEVDPGATTLPAGMVAEEIAHFFPPDLIEVSNDLPPGPGRDAADAALATMPFVTVRPGGATHLVPASGSATRLALRADDGTVLTDTLGEAGDPAFAERLKAELQKVARVAQLLSVRTLAEQDAGGSQLPVQVCVGDEKYRATGCPPLEDGGVRRIGTDRPFAATVINRGTKPVYLYLLAIDPRNAVDLVLPKPGEFDRPLPPNQPYRRAQMTFDAAGPYRFLAIVTDRPIRAEAFQQSGNGARDLAACVSPLERLLCSSSQGMRDPGVAAVGNWSAQVMTVLVADEGADR